MKRTLLLAALVLSQASWAQEDIPTLEPQLKESPSGPELDTDTLQPVPEAEPEPAPEEAAPEPIPEPEPLIQDEPPPPPKKKKKRRPPKARKAPEKAEASAKPAKAKQEYVIFGASLKYGFSSLEGSASEDDNAPTFGASLYVFQAPIKDSLGITAGLTVDYEESEIALMPELTAGFEDENATLSLTSVNLLVCFLSNYPAKICPFVGYGTASLEGEAVDFSGTVNPYGLNVVSGSPRIFKAMGLLGGGQIMLYHPVWQDDADREWSASIGSVSLYLGVSY